MRRRQHGHEVELALHVHLVVGKRLALRECCCLSNDQGQQRVGDHAQLVLGACRSEV